jgi:hypothetical protein
LGAYYSSDHQSKVDYTTEVDFELKQSLDGGTAESFDKSYGDISYELNGSNLGGYKFTVIPGNSFKLKTVTPNIGYAYSGNTPPITVAINSSTSHTIPFKRKFTVNYHEFDSPTTIKKSENFLYGNKYRTISYSGWRNNPGHTFDKWCLTADGSGKLFSPNTLYESDAIIPSGHSSTNPINLYPHFTPNTYTVTYYNHKDDGSACQEISTESVTYGNNFTLKSDLEAETVEVKEYELTKWKINGVEYSLGDTVQYNWEENIDVYPIVSYRQYKIIYEYNSISCYENAEYGEEYHVISKVYSESDKGIGDKWESYFGIPTHKKIVGWEIKDKGIILNLTKDEWAILSHEASNYTITISPIVENAMKMVVYDDEEKKFFPVTMYVCEDEQQKKWVPIHPYRF